MRKGTMKVVLTELEHEAYQAHFRATTGNTDGSTEPHLHPAVWQDRLSGLRLLRAHWAIQGEKRRRKVRGMTMQRFCALACRELGNEIQRYENGELYDQAQHGHLQAAWRYLNGILPQEDKSTSLTHLLAAEGG